MPVLEVAYAKVIEGFGLTHEQVRAHADRPPRRAHARRQFVDLCILCGCDYASTIRGTVLRCIIGRPWLTRRQALGQRLRCSC